VNGVPRGTEYEGDAPDLAQQISRIVGSGRVRASYGADARLGERHGAEQLVSVGIMNSDLGDRDSVAVERVLGLIAAATAEWLRQRGILTPGTLISIGLAREVDLRLVSWSWGTGGRRYWIGTDGRPTLRSPGDAERDDSH
jgi:hypothetical protein